MRNGIFSLVFIFCSTAYAADLKDKDAQQVVETRSIMSQLFASLTAVLPYAMKYSDFSDPSHRDEILSELKKMNDSTQSLGQHVKRLDSSYEFIAKSMSRDINDSYNRYKRGSYAEANYLLQQLSENCISCHMKVPDPGHAPKVDVFFKNVRIAELDPAGRAKLQVALRQFDDALVTWEKMFSDYKSSGVFYEMDALTEYLKVLLRVKMDLPRARKTLAQIAAKPSIPQFAKREVQSWTNSLTFLEPKLKGAKNRLTLAKSIVKGAQRNMDYPMDRAGFVEYVVASGLLSQFLAEGHSPKERAEAYYYLGTTESLIGRSVWIPQTAFYFESAIRTAPHSAMAAKAFDSLEQQTTLEYSGSQGLDLPDDVRLNLEELRKLAAHK